MAVTIEITHSEGVLTANKKTLTGGARVEQNGVVLHCRIDLNTDKGLVRTTIVVRAERLSNTIKYLVTTIRSGRMTTKGEPNLATAFATVAGIIDSIMP